MAKRGYLSLRIDERQLSVIQAIARAEGRTLSQVAGKFLAIGLGLSTPQGSVEPPSKNPSVRPLRQVGAIAPTPSHQGEHSDTA